MKGHQQFSGNNLIDKLERLKHHICGQADDTSCPLTDFDCLQPATICNHTARSLLNIERPSRLESGLL